jgi:phosphoribosylaminoimidazole-succinocarboxamide synthase
MTTQQVVTRTEFPAFPALRRGKVRDIYSLDGRRLLIVTTDRLSAFDVVLPNGIPQKGKVLTQLSRFWFERLEPLVENHLITTEVEALPDPLNQYHEVLSQRSMVVWRTEVIPIECVVRGYLAGSGWKEYRHTGAVCGISLPHGLAESARLSEPIFTPATKADEGHDINISEAEMADRIGSSLTKKLKELSLTIYRQAAEYAFERGIIICDTKFEFGLLDGRLVWIDEALTPDSSRFWAIEEYVPGGSPPSFDKQYVRDYLESIGWDKNPPAPHLPSDVVQETSKKYLMAYRLLTGKGLSL